MVRLAWPGLWTGPAALVMANAERGGSIGEGGANGPTLANAGHAIIRSARICLGRRLRLERFRADEGLSQDRGVRSLFRTEAVSEHRVCDHREIRMAFEISGLSYDFHAGNALANLNKKPD